MKVPSTRLRYESLPAHDDPTRFREVEALNWAQSDIRCGVTLVLTGSSHGETEPKKSNLHLSRTQQQHLTSLELIPAERLS
ncbi:hypothetical protein [Anabaena sp. 90]|uniref:hypothetical protein n=1 Tax=Anabaena sp. 90 TaxID=46234 RepID=UPI0002E12DD5|nr:hypothetical protein [Anabaena sp. 90]